MTIRAIAIGVLLHCLPVMLVGGSPRVGVTPSANTWFLTGHDRRVEALRTPLTLGESEWLKGVLETSQQKSPVQIGDWKLTTASVQFNPESSTPWRRDIYGARLRFEYANSKNQTIVIYHFINPVRVTFPELGWGYYMGFHTYHHKQDVLYSASGIQVIAHSGWLPLNSPMIPDADRELFNSKSMLKVCSYLGRGWTYSERSSASDVSEAWVNMGLKYNEKQWKKEVYGDLCIAAIPEDQDAKGIVLRYLERTNPQ